MMTPRSSESNPGICFVGPMVGRHRGRATMQSEILSNLFRGAGYSVLCVSSLLNRYIRLVDIVFTILAKRNQFSVMIVEVYSGPSFVVEDIATWLGKQLGKPMVLWLHGGALPRFFDRHQRWSKRVLDRACVLVAPSDFLARAVRVHGFAARVIPNVIDLAGYEYRNRSHLRPCLLWMRSFHPIWNPEMAIRVFRRLRNRVPDATLTMAGQDKGKQAEIMELANSFGLGDAIRFPGFLDAAAKVREGSAADIYINTNRVDNMPVAVLEACAMGLPVVATAVGGIPDLLEDGKTGILVPDDNDEEMANAVLRLLEDPELAGQLSANGRRLAERSSWDVVRSEWESVFQEIDINGKRKVPRSVSVSAPGSLWSEGKTATIREAGLETKGLDRRK